MALLDLITDVFAEVGISQTAPNAVVTSTDAQVLQLLALANSCGRQLMKRYEWQELTNYASFVTGGSIDVGTITGCFGAGFDRIINQTLWDTNTRLPIGTRTIQQWQNDQAGAVAGPPYYYVMFGNRVKIGPTAVASGHTITAYYISGNWCQSAAGVGQSTFAADDDTTVIPQELFKLSLIWMWKKSKGLSYAEDMATAESQIETQIGGNRGASVLYLGGSNRVYPENIPEGYWPG